MFWSCSRSALLVLARPPNRGHRSSIGPTGPERQRRRHQAITSRAAETTKHDTSAGPAHATAASPEPSAPRWLALMMHWRNLWSFTRRTTSPGGGVVVRARAPYTTHGSTCSTARASRRAGRGHVDTDGWWWNRDHARDRIA